MMKEDDGTKTIYIIMPFYKASLERYFVVGKLTDYVFVYIERKLPRRN